jgi:hypothetical protein
MLEISAEEFDNSNHYSNIKGDFELRQLIVDDVKKKQVLFMM